MDGYILLINTNKIQKTGKEVIDFNNLFEDIQFVGRLMFSFKHEF